MDHRIRVLRVGPGYDTIHARHVFDRAAHRPTHVAIEGERDDAVARGGTDRRPDPDESQVRRRTADRVPRVGSEPDHAESGGDAAGRPPARPCGSSLEVVCVARASVRRADTLAGRERPLGHIGLGEDDRSGRADTLHLRGIVGRQAPRERDRPTRRRKIGGVEVVLHQHGDAVKGPRHRSPLQLGVEGVGASQRGRVHLGDGSELAIIRLDPIEMGLHNHAARGSPALERFTQLGDRQLDDGDRAGRRPAADEEQGDGRHRRLDRRPFDQESTP